MRPSDFGRTLYHPERGVLTLDRMLAMYAWHSAHHLAHIRRCVNAWVGNNVRPQCANH